MHRTSLSGFLFAMLVAGCVVEGPTAFDVGEREQAVSDLNRLSVNRLSVNRLSLNRLSVNRLSLNRLSLNRLSLNGAASDGLETTEQGRELLTYVARCALNPQDILVAEHAGVTYEFPGLLGVAPEWEHAPLTSSLQRWVSACLLAHVNAFDTSVPISLRATEKLEFDVSESVDFPVYEATFFGNVFNVDQVMYACTGDMPDVANVLSEHRELRACSDPANANGTSACEFVAVGRCRDVCNNKSPGMGWSGCAAGGTTYGPAVSVYLLSTVPDDGNMYCEPGERCEIDSDEQDGSVVCTGADRCESDLSDGGVYKVDCAGAERCETTSRDDMLLQLDCAGTERCETDVKDDSYVEIECQDGERCETTIKDDSYAEIYCQGADRCVTKIHDDSHAEIDCQGAERCETEVKDDSYAEIDCQGADHCDKTSCTKGSTCVLDCTGADDCRFKKCDGQVRQCAGDVLVCNGQCPT
jgi:hypothetical protein